MKFEIGTKKLDMMLSKAMKGVGNGKVLPITAYFKLGFHDGVLSITGTNLNHFITINEKGISGEDGEALVKADKLVKLASRTTKDVMKFELLEKELQIKGNGSYKLELLSEQFPEYTFNLDVPTVEVDIEKLQRMLIANKYSLAKDMMVPYLAGYYLDSQSISTDGVKMCINDSQFLSTPALIPQELADLLLTLEGEKVFVQHDENKLLFSTDKMVILGTELEGVEQYPNISGVLAQEYESCISVSKETLLEMLDRLSLFVDAFDNNRIELHFSTAGLSITDKHGNSIEEFENIISHDNPQEYTASVNLTFLTELVSAVQEATVVLYYGNEMSIKIADDDVTLVLCLVTDETEEGEE